MICNDTNKEKREGLYHSIMPLDYRMTITELDELDFFTAPASTVFHGAYEGSLFDHSIEVTKTSPISYK